MMLFENKTPSKITRYIKLCYVASYTYQLIQLAT